MSVNVMLGIATLAITVSQCNCLPSRNYIFSSKCYNPTNHLYKVDGAVVLTQDTDFYTEANRTCAFLFETPEPDMQFLIQFIQLDIRNGSNSCPDSLTIRSLSSSSDPGTLILDEFCGSLSDVEAKQYAPGGYLEIIWSTGPEPSGHRGLQMTLTAVSQSPTPCGWNSNIRCSNEDCISKDLVCDGVGHCYGGEDELSCKHKQPLKDTTLSSMETPTVPTYRTHNGNSHTSKPHSDIDDNKEVYLWLPLIVVVIFTGIMVTLILIGRRAGENNHDTEAVSDTTDSNLRINGNLGSIETEPGMPQTPPPSYSVIARQTSYVSHISQTSDQISLPPGYEEAIELPGDRGSGRRRSRLRRSSTGSGGRRSNRPRIFSRSTSSSSAGNGRPRYTTQQSTGSDNGRMSTLASDDENNSVFLDPPPAEIEELQDVVVDVQVEPRFSPNTSLQANLLENTSATESILESPVPMVDTNQDNSANPSDGANTSRVTLL